MASGAQGCTLPSVQLPAVGPGTQYSASGALVNGLPPGVPGEAGAPSSGERGPLPSGRAAPPGSLTLVHVAEQVAEVGLSLLSPLIQVPVGRGQQLYS